jgi:nitroreductase
MCNEILANIKHKIKELVIKFFSKALIIKYIFSFFCFRSFCGEYYAVISGICRNFMERANIGNFRRNIHIIEKGLVTVPNKPVFAESFIIKTVRNLKVLIKTGKDSQTIIWALGILNQYFSTVYCTVTITKAKKEFKQIILPENNILPKTYLASDRIESNISWEDFHKLNLRRRSVRYYQSKSIPHNLVENAIKIALLAPSACNRQPFTFRIIDDFLLIREATQLLIGAASFGGNIKMIIFIVGDLSNFFDGRDKHLIYIDGSLVAMNFVLALETLGLSTCIINWSDLQKRNRKLKKILNLKKWERCIMSISVGYADPKGGITSSIKKNVQSIIRYN